MKPDLSNIRIFGCKAYVRINKLPKLAKLEPRAAIGYLVGYEAYNIWRIWIPTKRRVIRARDVEFNEQEFYNPSLANQRIRIYDDANPTQEIAILDEEETSRILEDIDIPLADQSTNSPVQQALGGGSTTTTEFDHATPSQDPQDPSGTSDSSHIRLTPKSEPLNTDEILGDQPITPPLHPKSDDSIADSDQSLDNLD
jgi:hypothetical protein